MTRDLDRAERRGVQYWYDDGLTEIAAGCIFVAIGLLFLLEALTPRGSLPNNFSNIGLVVLVAGGMWIANWAVKRLKARITYPRTGYVQYRRPPRTPQRRILAMVLGAAVSIIVVAGLMVTAPASLGWIPAMQGVFIGCFILYMGYSAGVARFYLMAVVSFAIGLSASLAGLGDTLGNGVYFAAMGLVFLLSGGAALANYLRSTRPSEGE